MGITYIIAQAHLYGCVSSSLVTLSLCISFKLIVLINFLIHIFQSMSLLLLTNSIEYILTFVVGYISQLSIWKADRWLYSETLNEPLLANMDSNDFHFLWAKGPRFNNISLLPTIYNSCLFVTPLLNYYYMVWNWMKVLVCTSAGARTGFRGKNGSPARWSLSSCALPFSVIFVFQASRCSVSIHSLSLVFRTRHYT